MKHETLSTLAALITRLRGELLNAEQRAFDLLGGEAECEAAIAQAAEIRAVLDLAMTKYFELSEQERTQASPACPKHQPGVLILSCDACRAAWDRKFLGPKRSAA